MAQIDKLVESYLLQNPAIAKAYSAKLINRRALARRIIEENREISLRNFEAVIAALRRAKFDKENVASKKISSSFRVSVKDDIMVASLAKTKDIMRNTERLMQKISYEKNETFKFVLGSDSIKIFLDEKNLHLIDSIATKKDILYIRRKISEFSLHFGESASSSKGILSYVSSALSINDIAIEEFLTCSPELLIYVDEKNTLKAYDTLKKMQK
ncbi:hypothetical protein COU37_01120 [Candidatus Micrarchaeota archaeon CG10_big_fil_rev_8_21_14_0_10_45_29]|nr:MAG: hypothetical protein COU37_01120 [Candidatus Micrarchaeota archaeon CG10_big_fil_rev_8_21_14_0_10_45_29]